MQHRRLNVKGYGILNTIFAGGLGECVVVDGCGDAFGDVGVRGAHPNLRAAHMHVKGGGPEVKIGQNGKPIKGSPELTSTQQRIVEQNKSTIRKAARKMQRWHDYLRNNGE